MSIEKSEPTKPFIVGIGEKFYPYALPQENYYGFPPDDRRFYRYPKAVTITLHMGALPDLDFQIVTIPPEVKAGKSEIIVESSIRQALQLGLMHKTGRRSVAFPSFQPYGFNEDVLPLVQRLRFSFLDSESVSEARPEIRRRGQVQFNFVATEDKMTSDLGAKFNLAENPVEEGIKAAAMGDPEKERRLRDSFRNGPTGLTSSGPDFGAILRQVDTGKVQSSDKRAGQEFQPKGKIVNIREIDGKLVRFIELDGKVYIWNSENKLEGYEGTIPLREKPRPFRF